VRVRELAIRGAWEFTPQQFGDDRGMFLEWFKGDEFRDLVGRDLDLRQANMSVSAAGVIRGIHFADIPPGQAKYVTCPKGAVFDVVVDIRVGSPTFGAWDAVLLDDVDRRAVYVSEGLGHGFCSLEDGSVVTYLCSAGYAPSREHGIAALDRAVGIDWPSRARGGSPLTHELSAKDAAAPTLRQAAETGLLPAYADASAYFAVPGAG
jgi:dTDP-4-dehydrorhamnose 3,5-epimerase